MTLGGCSIVRPNPVEAAIPLEGALLEGDYQGVITRTDGQASWPEEVATATVTDGGAMANFYAGCNRMRAPITADGIGPAISTRMMCPDMTNEDHLAAQLDSGQFLKHSESSFSVGDIMFSRVG